MNRALAESSNLKAAKIKDPPEFGCSKKVKGLLFYLRAAQGRSTGTNKNPTRGLGAYVPRGTHDKRISEPPFSGTI